MNKKDFTNMFVKMIAKLIIEEGGVGVWAGGGEGGKQC